MTAPVRHTPAALPASPSDELTTREAALYLGLSVRTFWRVAAPSLRCRRYSLRSIRWPRSQLDALKAAVTEEDAEPQPRIARPSSSGMAALRAKHGIR